MAGDNDLGFIVYLAIFMFVVMLLQLVFFGVEIWEISFTQPVFSSFTDAAHNFVWWNPLTWFEVIFGMAGAIYEILVFMFNMLTFAIPELPIYARLAIVIPIWTGIGYILVKNLMRIAEVVASAV